MSSAATTVPDAVRVHPGPLAGTVRVPGDKSLSHRALLLGALAGGPVHVTGLAPSADVLSTASALRRLGARVDLEHASDGVAGTVEGPLREADDVLDCGNSGTSLRLLAGVTAGIGGIAVLTGDRSLRRRPVDRVVTPLRAMGAEVSARAGNRLPPLVVRGGGLHAVSYDSPIASAQVKSAVLLAAVTAGVEATITSPLRSRDHTERMLRYLDADVEREEAADGRERVRYRPGPLAARPIAVLGDPSSAAFWLVAAAASSVADTGDDREVRVTGLCTNRTRLGSVVALRALGADIAVDEEGEVAGEPSGSVAVRPAGLAGVAIGGAEVVDAIDELPVLALAGALSAEGLEVTDASELRVKESDRIAATARALGALGIRVEERPDGFRVPGGQRPGGGTVDAGGDHRIAMTAAIAGTLATAPVVVTDFACVGTSYPTFLDDLRALGGRVEVLDGGGGR